MAAALPGLLQEIPTGLENLLKSPGRVSQAQVGLGQRTYLCQARLAEVAGAQLPRELRRVDVLVASLQRNVCVNVPLETSGRAQGVGGWVGGWGGREEGGVPAGATLRT